MQYKVEKIKKHHDRKSFNCGITALNSYLQTTARQANERHISKTFVACDPSVPQAIMGFLTLSTISVFPSPNHSLYTDYPHPLYGIKLARMGVDLRYQGQALGSQLIIHALRKTTAISEQTGVIGLFVDPKNTQLIKYYATFGFEKVDPDSPSLEMWLPLSDCEEAVAQLPPLEHED